ncbi:MAG TPA: CrcB family protein [Mycobacteriales bacterium]|nr:CrcB family protein [Mycobacteriales bacterium]
MLVALGAGLGAVLRYLLDRAVPAHHFPRGTVLVNTSGSFALGVVTASVAGGASAFLATGLLGGYTTLSTFAVETVALAERQRRGAALLNVAVSAVLGLGAAALGLHLGSRL